MCLSEDDVRRIVREETARTLRLLEDTARGLRDWETGELEEAGLQAVESAAETALKILSHSPDCDKRHRWYRECTCGVGET
jgi:hypothetical protein